MLHYRSASFAAFNGHKWTHMEYRHKWTQIDTNRRLDTHGYTWTQLSINKFLFRSIPSFISGTYPESLSGSISKSLTLSDSLSALILVSSFQFWPLEVIVFVASLIVWADTLEMPKGEQPVKHLNCHNRTFWVQQVRFKHQHQNIARIANAVTLNCQVWIQVLNCQKFYQFLKCHKSLGLLFEGAL